MHPNRCRLRSRGVGIELDRGALDTRLTAALGTETSARIEGDGFLQNQVTSLETKHTQDYGLIGGLNTAVFGTTTPLVEGLRETVTRQGAGLYGLTLRVATLEAGGSFVTVWGEKEQLGSVLGGYNRYRLVRCGVGAIAVSGMWSTGDGVDVPVSRRLDPNLSGPDPRNGWEIIFHRRALPLDDSYAQPGVVCWQPPA